MYTDPPENLRKFIDANAELFAYISKHTGAVSMENTVLLLQFDTISIICFSLYFTCTATNTQNITSIAQGEQLYNILFIEKTFGLELPKWTDSVYPKKLLALAERNLAVLTENEYMKRVRGGKIDTRF